MKKFIFLLIISYVAVSLIISVAVLASDVNEDKSTNLYSNSEANNTTNGLISTSPSTILFDVSNMKPGDWVDRVLTIQNRGKQDFNYHMEVKRKGGSERLFNALVLEVNVGDDQLFRGNLNELNDFESRLLQAEHEEKLLMTVEFPHELGNEYQGLDVDVEFKFIAEGKPAKDVIAPSNQSPIDKGRLDQKPREGEILPTTKTNIFNFFAIGVSLLMIGLIIYLYRVRKNAITKFPVDI